MYVMGGAQYLLVAAASTRLEAPAPEPGSLGWVAFALLFK